MEEEHIYQLQIDQCLKINKKSKKELNSNKGTVSDSKFLLTDDEDRRKYIDLTVTEILSDQIDLTKKKLENTLLKSKFSSENNYLWDKCKYFSQPNESFYVKMFLKSANFNVGGLLFINRTQTEVYNLFFYFKFKSTFKTVEILNDINR